MSRGGINNDLKDVKKQLGIQWSGSQQTELKYKNPALLKVQGVLTSYCLVCRNYNGNEYDTGWYTLIRRKYCPECKVLVEKYQAAERQRTRRMGMKQLRQESVLKDEVIELLREQITIIREENAKLKNERNIRK